MPRAEYSHGTCSSPPLAGSLAPARRGVYPTGYNLSSGGLTCTLTGIVNILRGGVSFFYIVLGVLYILFLL